MKIGVIGTGYVGLVTGACLAESGNYVTCMDIDEAKIERLSRGEPTIYEPGLRELLENNLAQDRLRFTTDVARVVTESSVLFIAVDTPSREDGSADTTQVMKVAEAIGVHMDDYKIVVTKSTVPVGLTERIRDRIRELTTVEFDVASNPEFLKEGSAVEDFMKPDRVVIGVDKPEVGDVLRELYQPFMRSADRALIVSIRSAELAKYASNAMLALRISFMNEVANLCELLGADVSEVRRVMGADHRIGRHFIFPGVGYGGSCFPKDVKALIHTARRLGFEFKTAVAADEVNTRQRELFVRKVVEYFGGDVGGRTIAVWGLAFKPKTDDMREAPSLYVVGELMRLGAHIRAHDPAAMENARRLFGDGVTLVERSYDACIGAEALLILTEWNQYRQPDFERMRCLMKGRAVFDGRNLYEPKKMARLGFDYYAVGLRRYEPERT